MPENWTCPQCNAFNPQRKNICWQCGKDRVENKTTSALPPKEPPRVRINTLVTMTRITLLIIVTIIFFGLRNRCTPANCYSLAPSEIIKQELRKWLPPFLFVVILLLRSAEKLLMQRSKYQISLYNVKLHQAVDMVGICIASIIGLALYQLPLLYLLVPVTHYLFLIGLWWRKRKEKPVTQFSPAITRQMTIESQIIISAAALWPVHWYLEQVAILFMLVFVIYQIRDWLCVVGVLNPLSSTYQKVAYWIKQLADWGPIGLRFLSITSLIGRALMLAMLIGSSSAWKNPTPEMITKVMPVVIAIVLILISVFFMITLGIAGRAAAVILLFISILLPASRFLEIYAFLLLYLGTGKLSLWTEDKLLTRWLAKDLMTQHPDGKNAQALQDLLVRQNKPSLEIPVEWQEPFKLSNALKNIVKITTLILVSYYAFFIVFMIIVAITFITRGPENASGIMTKGLFISIWELHLVMIAVSLGLIIFYFIHILKNTTASSVARVIFGIGIYAMPPIAMPLY